MEKLMHRDGKIFEKPFERGRKGIDSSSHARISPTDTAPCRDTSHRAATHELKNHSILLVLRRKMSSTGRLLKRFPGKPFRCIYKARRVCNQPCTCCQDPQHESTSSELTIPASVSPPPESAGGPTSSHTPSGGSSLALLRDLWQQTPTRSHFSSHRAHRTGFARRFRPP